MGILVVAEHRRGRVEEVTLEVISKGREIADGAGMSLRLALLGKDTSSMASELASYPVDEVLVVDDDLLQEYTPEAYGGALAALLELENYRLVMGGHSSTGMEFIPRIAGDLGSPLVTDAVDVRVEGSTVLVTRMGYNGKVAVELAVEPSGPCFVTLRPAAFKAAEPSATAPVRRVQVDMGSLDVKREVLGYEKPEAEDIDISEADIVVAAGRGIREKENLKLMEDLARALGGVVAGSRPIVDKGWLPWSRQVGSSGKTVRPKLYIACGISGAMQHITGMKGSETIVAINVDPTAPIFSVAHYGIVGDLFQVIPQVLKQLGEG
ncbi:MAG: electron transfer flavoprotein subunit alpha/FixB family protein [Thermoplasmata archaeon]